MKKQLRAYFHLLKPGITISNTLSAVAGYFLGVAVIGEVFVGSVLGLIVGIAAVIGSACVANNVLDRRIDTVMKRTKKREVVTGVIGAKPALVYSAVLAVVGFVLLALTTNGLTVLLGLIAYISYVALYGWAKRTTKWSTLIGTLPGALPLVAGYTTVTNQVDAVALVIGLMMVLWQLGHFYAIAIFRRDDYAAAGLPIWSVAHGTTSARKQLFVGVWLFALTAPLLTILRATGWIYAITMTGVALWWALKGLKPAESDEKWARRMFLQSLWVLLVMCLLIGIGGFLP